MAANVATRQTTVTHLVTAAAIEVTGADGNDTDGSELRYYITATASDEPTLKSQVFSPSSDGKFVWDNVVFPAAGSWTLTLADASDDSTVDTTALTVD